MLSDRDKRIIVWRLHLKSPPRLVHTMLSTDKGRERFWASKSVQRNDKVEFGFPDGSVLTSKIVENQPPSTFVIEYFGGSIVSFRLEGGNDGTDLTLTAEKVKYYDEELPGWVSVLLALKTAVDFSIDIRNHDRHRTWEQGYCDN